MTTTGYSISHGAAPRGWANLPGGVHSHPRRSRPSTPQAALARTLLIAGDRMRPLTLVLLISLAGCNADGLGAGGPDMLGPSPDMSPEPFPAFSPSMPQCVSSGGPVLASPRFVPVFFGDDDPAFVAQVEDFLAKVGGTNYWKAAVSEYGVGPGVSTAGVHLTETAPTNLSDGQIRAWLEGKLNSDDPAFPVADKNTLYVLHYTAGTSISLPGGGGAESSCVQFGGYHGEARLNSLHGGISVAYAVIPRCGNFDGLTGIDAVTGAGSHELAEAVTDPYPDSNTAYQNVDDDHIYWIYAVGGGEVGDMCAQNLDSFTKFDELPYVVQRIWSNKAALAGHDPCQPELPNEIYFNSAPVLTDQLNFSFFGNTKGVKIPSGMSKTIDLQLFSEGPVGKPWTVSVEDTNQFDGSGATPRWTFALDKKTGLNGDTIHVTITPRTSAHSVGTFVVISSHGSRHTWFGLVGSN